MVSSHEAPHKSPQCLGVKLREVRVRRGLTQEGLALMAGYARSYILAIERGERTNLTLEALGRLADALGVRPGDLLGEEDLDASGSRDSHLKVVLESWPHLPEGDREELAWMARRWARMAMADPGEVCDAAELESNPGERAPAVIKGIRKQATPAMMAPGRGAVSLASLFDVVRGFEVSSGCIQEDSRIRKDPKGAQKSAVEACWEFRSAETLGAAIQVRRDKNVRWVPCLVADDLRPLAQAKTTRSVMEIPHVGDDLKQGFLRAHGSVVVWEPRTLLATVVDSALAFPRVLYGAALRPGKGLQSQEACLCRRLALLICSDFWPVMTPDAAFFHKSVIPPVRVFRRAPVPAGLLEDTALTRDLDKIGAEVITWAREVKCDRGLKTFDQHLLWRRTMPHRERINQLIQEMAGSPD